MSHYLLSKTSYIKGLQCSKALFLYRYYPQLRDPFSPSKKAVFSRGHEVGFLARDLFPGGKDATEGRSPKSKETVGRTTELMKAGESVIYEAAFVHNEVLVLVDILVRDGEKWKAYEVKSSLRLSRAYYDDAALQYYVLSGAGLQLSGFFLVHLSSDYVRNGEIALPELFTVVPVLDSVKKKFAHVAGSVLAQKQLLSSPQVPEVRIGGHCFSPYECDFRGQCWKNVPKGNVFELAGINRAEQERLFHAGYVFPEMIPAEENIPALVKLHSLARRSEKTIADREKLNEFLRDCTDEMLFLDIENFQPAVPKFEGTKPFQALPFAYSIHRKRGNETRHSLFIAEHGKDPRREFLGSFLRDTEGDAVIFAYDASAEKTTLNLLKKQFPEFSQAIDQRLARIRDLMRPFSEGWYYAAAMNCSVSLKSVLPALVPGMNYENLRIMNGGHAMSVYEKLGDEDLFGKAESISALEEYCAMDTMGMLKIFEVLEKEAQAQAE
ncbi:MAG TPA: DUF2779 domain-containing protein [Bacteroidia bacterium]|nr:DUF2779 domain-containing protein [Bacteroidia bacterium]